MRAQLHVGVSTVRRLSCCCHLMVEPSPTLAAFSLVTSQVQAEAMPVLPCKLLSVLVGELLGVRTASSARAGARRSRCC